MKTCKCGHENPSDAKFCEKCGAKLSDNKGLIIGAMAVLALLLIGGIYYVVTHTGKGQGSTSSIGSTVDSVISPANSETRENVLDYIRKAGVLRVAVESEAQPFNWIDEATGKSAGFEYELITNVAKEMGIDKVELEWTGDYKDIPNMISKEKNKADIFMGGYVANPNIPNVAWSDSYYEENGYCLVVPNGSAIKSLKDLTGKKIGVYNEDAAEAFVKENVNTPQAVYRFEDEDEDGKWMMNHLLDHLAKQKKRQLVDAIIYDYVFAKEEIKESEGQLKIVAFNLNKLPYQIGLPKNNYDLLKEVNRALKKVMDSPVYAQLVKKYLDFDPTSVSLPSLGKNVKKHTVVGGETLGSIAQKELGNIQRWQEIWDANKMRIPNPNLIHVGDQLIMP